MILYTSDNSPRRRSAVRTGFVYIFVSVFCAFFGAVYEYFSHDVMSYFMIYAFAFPLVGGAVPYLGLALSGRRVPSRLASNLYNSGIAALTAGSVFRGVLEIYGTTNSLSGIYWIAGLLFVAAAAAVYFIRGNFQNS